uniref:Uncharacterized protein n=1 Tax=Salmonella enterica subsp. enterica serovar Saintpaul TaxID=90105 RepID=A0A1S0Z787_SALET
MVKMDKVVLAVTVVLEGQEDSHRKEIIIKKAVAILRRNQPMQMEVRRTRIAILTKIMKKTLQNLNPFVKAMI